MYVQVEKYATCNIKHYIIPAVMQSSKKIMRVRFTEECLAVISW